MTRLAHPLVAVLMFCALFGPAVAQMPTPEQPPTPAQMELRSLSSPLTSKWCDETGGYVHLEGITLRIATATTIDDYFKVALVGHQSRTFTYEMIPAGKRWEVVHHGVSIEMRETAERFRGVVRSVAAQPKTYIVCN